jgi:hypothetical protein
VAAALVVAAGRPRAVTFVTLDRRQATAAAVEGLAVLGPA